jgi:hypothetical protein
MDSISSNPKKKISSKHIPSVLFALKNLNLYGVQQDIESGWMFLCFSANREDDNVPFIVLIARSEKGRVIQANINMSTNANFDKNESLKFKLIQSPFQQSSLSQRSCFSFYLYGSTSISLFSFYPNIFKFDNFKYHTRAGVSDTELIFSQKRNLFFIPNKNIIQVYDDKMEFLLDTIETEKNIEQIVLNDKKGMLLIYDLYFYYEVDLDKLSIQRKLLATNSTKDRFFMPLNLLLLPQDISWKGVFYHIGRKTIRSVSMSETLELSSFPFETFNQCFDPREYQNAIKVYSQYYFSKLSLTDRNDYEFGPISPLNMCIYHENSSLLEEVFNDFYYPCSTHGYVSPLEFAFLVNHKASINELCQALLRRDESIAFSRSDFKFLLSSDLNICHKVISTMMSDPQIASIPRLVYMEKEMLTKSSDFLASMAIQMRREDHKKEQQAKKIQPKSESISGLKKFEMSNNVQISKREISITAVPFKYNYTMGTDDSVMLVNRFTNSRTEDFILSDWREIILTKWTQAKFPYILFFFVYFGFLTLTTLSLVFFKSNDLLRYITMGVSLLFLFYEILRLITYMTYKPIL